MKKVLFLFLFIPFFGFAQKASTNEYQIRREKVLSMLDTSDVLVLKAINASPVANEYVPESNLLYLTGIQSTGSYLLMSRKGITVGSKKKNSIIFYTDIKDVNDIALSASDTILKSFEFKAVFSKLIPSITKLYYSAPDLFIVNDWLNDKVYFMEREMKNGLKAKNTKIQVFPADRIIGKLRAVKSSNEVELIQKATDITADGVIAAMKVAKPKVWEYELQATIEYEFTRQGSHLLGFPSIVGSGPNNIILHYSDNNRQTQEGDLVVMDVGAKYEGYSSDITRTIPVSGKFTDAQKEVYNIVLQVQKGAIAMLKPGLPIAKVEEYASNEFKKLGYLKFYTHSLSHPVGLDVHDVMAESVLKPGMVITIEPGLYFDSKDTTAPEKYKGFGVRIEDTILITENGCEILSKKAPKEIDEIEKVMKKKN